MILNELSNRPLQFLHAVMRATFNLALAQESKPALDLVEPGTVRGSKMQVVSGTAQQLVFDRRSFVGAVIIHDQVHLQMLRHLSVDVVEEFSEFSRAMPAKTFAHHISRSYVQRGE